eukprot:scaffold283804_cov19-Tisochrysis_lutea.AAC.1
MQIHSISGQPGPDRIRKHGGKQAKSSLRESSLKSLLQTKHAGFMNGSFVCLGVTDCDHAHLTRVCCMYGIFKGHFGSGESWVRGTPGKGGGKPSAGVASMRSLGCGVATCAYSCGQEKKPDGTGAITNA